MPTQTPTHKPLPAASEGLYVNGKELENPQVHVHVELSSVRIIKQAPSFRGSKELMKIS